MKVGAKTQYLQRLLHAYELREFKTICAHIGNTTTSHLNEILLGLFMYFLIRKAQCDPG